MNIRLLLSIILIGAAMAAPLNIKLALTPVTVRQSDFKSVITLPQDPASTLLILKFDQPILAEVSKNPLFRPTDNNGESAMIKLELMEELKEPTVVEITDKKTGDKVMVMVAVEGMKK